MLRNILHISKPLSKKATLRFFLAFRQKLNNIIADLIESTQDDFTSEQIKQLINRYK
jgi:hypothetical protein